MATSRFLVVNGVAQNSGVPSVSSLLESTPGAYTTTRTYGGAAILLFWDRHLRRLRHSVELLSRSYPRLLGSAHIRCGNLTSKIDDSLRIALDLALAERKHASSGAELAVTALVGGREGGDADELYVWLHIGFYAPPVYGRAGANLAVAGPGRGEAAEAKYSDWARARKGMEKMRPPGATELLLSDDGDRILEGSVTNFFVVCQKDDRSYEVQTAPVSDRVLPGIESKPAIFLSLTAPMAATAATAAEVYSPGPNGTKSLQVWRTLMSWLGFVFQIFIQILKGTPSILSFVGLRHSLICSSPGHSFKPLPVDEPPPPLSDLPFPKLTIVLDLDETLVCAYETSSLPEAVKRHAIDAGLTCFELECLSVEKDAEGKPKVNHVTVFERPGLREFLQKISEFADLVLFTAGLEGYARPLVDRIDVDKKFRLRLYRPSTISTEYREHVKDLSCISKDLCRVVIVDNNPFSFLVQPLNGIPCVPFSAGQPYDEQLIAVLLPLLRDLSLRKDVRPALYEKFHMPEWFQQHGIPTHG